VHVTSTLLPLRAGALLLAPALAVSPALAQHTPTPAPAPAIAPYQLPLISIAQPAAGVPLPADRPVVLVRFAAREPGDPIDPASFAITVDGKPRTAAFTVRDGEAWGLIRDGDSWDEGGSAQAGTHVVAARICSTRGACAEVTSTVEVKASAAAGTGKKSSTRDRFILLLLRAAHRIIEP